MISNSSSFSQFSINGSRKKEVGKISRRSEREWYLIEYFNYIWMNETWIIKDQYLMILVPPFNLLVEALTLKVLVFELVNVLL